MRMSAAVEGKATELPRKTNKTRRETAVQGTNDSSIVSKCSTSSCGYFNDTFLHYFVSKHSRRAPLIHRGYYIRAVAFDRILRNFLELNRKSKNQIISLGCGFDSSYFRLKAAQLLGNTVFCEIDFPELVRRKRLLIENTEDLITLVEKTNEQPPSPHIEFSCRDYHLLGVDLTQLNTLEAALKMCGVDFECPTLLLSECVMTYMTRRCSTELVKWAAETFENAVFGMYEQMNPDDAFGLFMQNHFHSIGSPLKCINAFPSLESQVKRFHNTGWAWCEALDMNTFYYNHIAPQEQRRIEGLETFDEYEELNLKYSHYFILTAATVNPTDSLIKNKTSSSRLMEAKQMPSISDVLTVTRSPEDVLPVRRFGHASSLVSGRYAVTSGGFGEIDGRHQRLAEITVTDLDALKSFHIPCCPADVQCSRMHHASVPLSNGTIFLIGGRQSPYFMCNQMLKVKLHLNPETPRQLPDAARESSQDNSVSVTFSAEMRLSASQTMRDTQISQSQPQTNTTTGVRTTDETFKKKNRNIPKEAGRCDKQGCDSVNVSKNSGGDHNPSNSVCDECVSCINTNTNCDCSNIYDPSPSRESENSSPTVLSWNFELGQLAVSVINQEGSVPKERWRHAAVGVFLHEKEMIFLHGGKTKVGEVLEDTFLFDPASCTWEQLSCSGDLPGPRHSHCLTYWNGQVILTGGLDSTQAPVDDVYMLDLVTKVWEKVTIVGNVYSRYSHTAHLQGDKLVLVGGVNLYYPPPGIAVINLVDRKALEFALPVQEKSNLLMFHRHTSVSVTEEHITVLGGGGNCFSFGTHLNRTPVVLNVGPCIDVLQ